MAIARDVNKIIMVGVGDPEGAFGVARCVKEGLAVVEGDGAVGLAMHDEDRAVNFAKFCQIVEFLKGENGKRNNDSEG